MMQYGHVYTAICIIIKLKVMFWKLYTRIDFNVGTFKITSIKNKKYMKKLNTVFLIVFYDMCKPIIDMIYVQA